MGVHPKVGGQRDAVIKQISDSILLQIQSHIDKNTVFPRVRLNKHQEDLVTQQGICINCDSLLLHPEFCQHCGFEYDRKTGAITGTFETPL